MYEPDRVFMQRLKALDKRLGCEYAWGHGHFVITYKRANGDDVPLFVVEAEDGGFRQPDRRDLDFLMKADLERESIRDRLDRTAKYMEDVRAHKRRTVKGEIRDMTKESKIQISSILSRMAGGGKGNATFRRITHKPKGQVFAAPA
jgi:hypothetical protein